MIFTKKYTVTKKVKKEKEIINPDKAFEKKEEARKKDCTCHLSRLHLSNHPCPYHPTTRKYFQTYQQTKDSERQDLFTAEKEPKRPYVPIHPSVKSTKVQNPPGRGSKPIHFINQ